MAYQSIATIKSPEFINLQPLDINPLMSKCEIKVLYIGENRNRSYITEEVAANMAKTLRGAPIVGYYKEEKEDFADHGEQVIFDDEGIKFNCLTKPYGFVAPDAKVWFQEFEDTDEFGNKIIRKYLMTTGFLWTEQFKEAKRVIEKGNGQSMELDEDTLDGHWSTNVNNNMEFFIINDAIFSKLCILGDDVEPCFEGAKISAPEVSNTFTKVDDNFKKTLFTMMQDLKFALQEGGIKMELDNQVAIEEENNNEEKEVVIENEIVEEVSKPEEEKENEDVVVEDAQEEKKEEEVIVEEEKEEENHEETAIEEENNEEVIKEENNEFSLADYESLQQKYSDLEEKYNGLLKFKEEVEKKEKEELINSFYMLSDEDKKEVREHIAEYSLSDIEAKLSIICVRNKVNFDSEDSTKNNNEIEEENPVTTFNIVNEEESVPAWISACIKTQNSKNN